MTTLREILDDNIFKKVFKIDSEESKISLIKLCSLYGGFDEGQSNILTPESALEKLNSEAEFSSAQDFNQKVLQKIYQKIRPVKSDGTGLVERKDMQNPANLSENISQINLASLLEILGVFEEKKPPVLDNNVRVILNGSTQVGCQERINSVKSFIDQGLIPENSTIDLATGSRDLWPDGIGGNDSNNFQPDEMLSILLAKRVGKSIEEITQTIARQRAELIQEYQKDNPELTINNLSPKQKSDLRLNITKNLKLEFIKFNPEFVWPQESDMFFRLAQENFPSMKVIVHGGAADQNQGRATGVTGLRKVALDLIEEIRNNELTANINLPVIAGGGHALRFSAILFDEIKNAANANNTPDLINSFAFYPAGPSFPKDAFIVSANNSAQNIAQNLLNLVEANLGAINHEMTRNISVERPATSPKNPASQQVQEVVQPNLNP